MSGGKQTTESATFEPIIAPALLSALKKIGTEALAEAGKAMEYQNLLKQEEEKYNRSLEQQKEETRKALEGYKRNISAEVRRLESELRKKGVTFPQNTDTAESRLQLLYSLLNTNETVKSSTDLRTYYVCLKTMESAKELFIQICNLADQIIAKENEYREQAVMLKQRAEKLISTGTQQKIGEYKSIYEELNEIHSKAMVSQERIESLKKEFMAELARAKALCKITNTLTVYPVFSPDTAEQAILRLKAISSRQIAMIEEIKKNPCLHMSPEKREKACETVATKICAALTLKGMQLKQVSILNKSRICYYYYKEALLKVAVTDTGAVTFEVVGNPEKKSGFSNYDKKRVLEAMERFQKEFPELQEELKKNNVVLTLEETLEPNESIVTYEKPQFLTAQQKAANDAAILQMLQAAQNVRYVEGN